MHLSAVLSLVTVASLTVLGGLWIASRKPSWYTNDRLSALVAVGAGLLLGIGFLEFIPVSMESGGHESGFLMLAGLMFILFVEAYISPKLNFFEAQNCDHDHAKEHDHKKSSDHEHHHHFISHQAACSAVGCLIVCAFFDGFKMNAAFLLGDHQGWIVSLGLFFHILPDGVLAASIALAGGMSRKSAMTVSWLTGVVLIAGFGAGALSAEFAGGTRTVIPFATGVLIYVALAHLLPVGAKHRWGLVLTLLGVIFYGLVHSISH